jgi:hypothetical protein
LKSPDAIISFSVLPVEQITPTPSLARLRAPLLLLVIPSEVENGASETSDMDGCAARAAAGESGDERVKSLDVFFNEPFVFRRQPEMASDQKGFPHASVDPVILDPPFNSNADYDVLFPEPSGQHVFRKNRKRSYTRS